MLCYLKSIVMSYEMCLWKFIENAVAIKRALVLLSSQKSVLMSYWNSKKKYIFRSKLYN